MKTINFSTKTDTSFPIVGAYSFKLELSNKHTVIVTYKYHPFKNIDDPNFITKVSGWNQEQHHAEFEFYGKATSQTGYRSEFLNSNLIEDVLYVSRYLAEKLQFEKTEGTSNKPKTVEQLCLFAA